MSSDKIATYSCLLLAFWVTYCYGFTCKISDVLTRQLLQEVLDVAWEVLR